jgi:glycosyltransferase involved in cell wall biosynthesis
MNAPHAPHAAHPIRVALVTNIPAPYRLPVFERLARLPDVDFEVVFCSGNEPDRAWRLTLQGFRARFLRARFVTFRGRYIHINPDVWTALEEIRPQVVVTTQFNPTHLIAFAWSRWRGATHVAMSDGTFQSEQALTGVHRAIRRHVFARTSAFVGASHGTLKLFRSYGCTEGELFMSHLCTDNTAFAAPCPPGNERPVDLLFSGRFVALKNPAFALEVARGVARSLGRRVSIEFLGSGPLEESLRAAASLMADDIDVRFLGFLQQSALPQVYRRCRVLLFPTRFDVWGVVANEACAAGMPVITTPMAGVAHEIVQDGVNGYVLPLVLERWVEATARLLHNDGLCREMAARGQEIVSPYNYDNAAAGLAGAVRLAHQASTRPQAQG